MLFLPVLICSFSRHNFRTQYFHENHHFKNETSVAPNPLVSLLGLFVARGCDNRQTDRPSIYCKNPRCACARGFLSRVYVCVGKNLDICRVMS